MGELSNLNFNMDMGEYALFIWASYAVWFAGVFGLVLHCYISYHGCKDDLKKIEESTRKNTKTIDNDE